MILMGIWCKPANTPADRKALMVNAPVPSLELNDACMTINWT